MPWQRGHCPGSAASPGFFQNEFLFISLEQNREFQPGQRELCCLLLPTLPLVLLLGNFLMLNETKVRFSPQTSGSFISRAEDVVQIHSGSSRWLLSPGDAENPHTEREESCKSHLSPAKGAVWVTMTIIAVTLNWQPGAGAGQGFIYTTGGHLPI